MTYKIDTKKHLIDAIFGKEFLINEQRIKEANKIVQSVFIPTRVRSKQLKEVEK